MGSTETDGREMTRTIQLTRKAIKDLQSFQRFAAVQEQIQETFESWRIEEHLAHANHLNHHDLWKARINPGGGLSLRIIFQLIDHSKIRVLCIAKRDERTYRNLDRRTDEELDTWTGIEWFDYLNRNERVCEQPEYIWPGHRLSTFISSLYNYSPALTPNQRSVIDAIIRDVRNPNSSSRRVGFPCQITQSPPGTGKTITAASCACEMYKLGWNVIFLLPEKLLEDVEKYECIRTCEDQGHQSDPNFFINTLQQWLMEEHHGIPLLSSDEERKILSYLAMRAERSRRNISFGEITERHVLLFHAYVLNPSTDLNTGRNLVFQENKETIEKLETINSHWWHEEVVRISRPDRSRIPDLIFRVEPSRNESTGTIIIIDEAQDYLVRELRDGVKKLCQRWHRDNHLTYLWLLGDINQRINPIDFGWGDLQLTEAIDPGWRCFRNSRNILKFSNYFLEQAREIARINQTRIPPKPPDPSRAFKDREKVRLLRYPSESAAERFLEHLDDRMNSREIEIDSDRSILYRLASRIKILHSRCPDSNARYSSGLEFSDVQEAKGREFDSCVIFNAFDPSGTEPTAEEWQQWYTLLTRPRFRLLIVITEEQLSRLESHISDLFRETDIYEFLSSNDFEAVDSAINWIQEISNDIEASEQQRSLVRSYLEEGLQASTPVIYWDTYDALDLVGINEDERTLFEMELLQNLRNRHSEEVRRRELENLQNAQSRFQDNRLKCFLHRSIGDYWEAAEAVESLRKPDELDNPSEYTRIIEAIAQDLENLEPLSLVFEAARLRHQKLGAPSPYPDDSPLSELIEEIGPLIPALVNVMYSRWPSD